MKYENNQLKLFSISLLVGVCSGLVIISYRILLKYIEHFREFLFLTQEINRNSFYYFSILIVILSISYITYFLMKKYPLIAGGGIPVVKGVFARKFKFNWFKDVFYKFIVGLLALVAGMSLGIEGPSVQLGAETGAGVAKKLKRPEYESKYFIACGASAGLAAAFNAPITGVIFVVEELVKHVSPLMITCTLISAVIASWISNNIFGLAPFFNFSTMENFNLSHFYLIAIFCFFITILGKLFFLGIIHVGALRKKLKLNNFFKILIPITIGFIISFYFYEITGGGHHLGEEILKKSFSLKYLWIVLIAKSLFTIYSSSTGIPGGIFVPMISLGMIAGKIFGTMVVMVLGPEYDYTDYFILIGMSSFLTTVVKAPLTSTVLAMEVVGSFNHFFPLAAATMFSMVFAEVFKMQPIYDIGLEQLLHRRKVLKLDQDEQDIERSDYGKTILTIPVSIYSYLENRRVSEINWPSNLIVTEIIRGDSIIVPSGDSKIFFGDTLTVYTDLKTAQEFELELIKMGEEPHYQSLDNDSEIETI